MLFRSVVQNAQDQQQAQEQSSESKVAQKQAQEKKADEHVPDMPDQIVLLTEAELQEMQSQGGVDFDTCSVCRVFRAFEGLTDECCWATRRTRCTFR